MPANDNFPNGWTAATGIIAAGGTVSAGVLGAAGVIHVLDRIFSRLINDTAGLAASTSLIANAGTILTLAEHVVAGSAYGADDLTFDSLGIATAPGGGLTVSWGTTVPTGYLGMIVIQGHDI